MKWLIILFLFLTIQSNGQNTKTYSATRVSSAPEIDGQIEPLWYQAETGSDFWMYEPYNQRKADFKTNFYILYDDQALYIACMMYDPQPDSIMNELGERDKFHALNADHISVDFFPFQDGMNGYAFKVTPGNLQADEKYSTSGSDGNWDAVWSSATAINDSGWVAEMRIPWSAVRFPNQQKQQWGFTIWRNIRRYREWDTWTAMDKTSGNIFNEYGILQNINNIEPPLRLSLTPYFSVYADRIEKETNYSYQGGLDLKYGLNESFTLDMTLIPDFGQVISDDIVLNLTPYEIQYAEKRQFFTEGTELFNKGEIFYSRRIGDTPNMYNSVDLQKDSNEVIVANPDKTQLINATKISGRTSGGLGIGFFNAMTSNTFATVKDDQGNKRNISTQPFTNYNMIVLDQNLKHNSYLAFVNTNVSIFKNGASANVSGTEFQFRESSKTYRLGGEALLSQKYKSNKQPDYGFSYEVNIEKEKGHFLFGLERKTISDQFDPNDMGYLAKNNYTKNEAEMTYRILNPQGIILNWNTNLEIRHEELYKPREYSSFRINLVSNGTFKNHLSLGIYSTVSPIEVRDFHEARVAYRPFIRPSSWASSLWFSTDYRRQIALDGEIQLEQLKAWDMQRYKFRLEPRLRVNDHLFFTMASELERSFNARGFVDYQAPDIIFGERNTQTIINTFSGRYAINVSHSINMRVRHYWARVNYHHYYLLENNGQLSPYNNTADYDINFNAFNVDFSYRWQFAPGSEMSVFWKNELLEQSNLTYAYYKESLQQIFEKPQFNSLSVKILYYIDYQSVKKSNQNT